MAIRSIAFEAALQDLATLLHRIALAQTVPAAIPDDEPERAGLFEFSQQFSAEEIQLFYQIAIHGRSEIGLAPDEYAGFTMTLLRMLAFAPTALVAPVSASNHSVSAAPQKAMQAAAPEAIYEKFVPAKPVEIKAVVDSSAAKPVAPATAKIAGSTQFDWNVLLAQLNVQGMARELAKNCVMESFVDGKICLSLAPQHKQFMSNKIAQDKLQAALSDYFAQPVRLQLSVGAPTEAATPAVVERQEKETRQQAAADAIAQDPFVREAQSQLDAQIIENSIKFIQ
jgi:DNA polymerase-3 subunit gamma/tau